MEISIIEKPAMCAYSLHTLLHTHVFHAEKSKRPKHQRNGGKLTSLEFRFEKLEIWFAKSPMSIKIMLMVLSQPCIISFRIKTYLDLKVFIAYIQYVHTKIVSYDASECNKVTTMHFCPARPLFPFQTACTGSVFKQRNFGNSHE